MNKKALLLMMGLFFVAPVSRADCPDMAKSCDAGAVGWQGQRWDWSKGLCVDVGSGFCPKPPSVHEMPSQAISPLLANGLVHKPPSIEVDMETLSTMIAGTLPTMEQIQNLVSEKDNSQYAEAFRCRETLLTQTTYKFDGCSVPLKDEETKNLKFIHDNGACHEHDVCYQTPGVPREVCDQDFYDNMKFACQRFYKDQVSSHPLLIGINGPALEACKIGAYAWYQAVVAKAQEAYATDQKQGYELCNVRP